MSGFVEAAAAKMPTLACIGTVSEVGEAVLSKKTGQYYVIKVSIEGLGASRSMATWFTFRPEWLVKGFNPFSLKEYENGKAMEKVYAGNIAAKGKASTLRILAGSKERFEELGNRINALPVDEKFSGPNPTDVADTLRGFLTDGNVIGYFCTQQQSYQGKDPETGKGIYVNEPYYEVKSGFDTDEKGRERVRKSAARSENIRLQFTEDDIPF